MTRDYDLIRRMLQDIEKAPVNSVIQRFDYADYDNPTIAEHVKLLKEGDLIEVMINETMGGGVGFVIFRLKSAGHDFLEVARNDTIWNNTMSTVKNTGLALTIDVLKQLLNKFALSAAGLN